jgi:hypothetical protein
MKNSIAENEILNLNENKNIIETSQLNDGRTKNWNRITD